MVDNYLVFTKNSDKCNIGVGNLTRHEKIIIIEYFLLG